MFDNLNSQKQDKPNSEEGIKQSVDTNGKKAPAAFSAPSPPAVGQSKGGVEDIFANVDKPEAKAEEGGAGHTIASNSSNKPIGGKKKYIMVGVGVLILAAAIGAAGWAYFSSSLSSAPSAPAELGGSIDEQNVTEQGGVNAGAKKETEDEEVQDPPLQPRPQDSDQDGLTDEEEIKLGMDTNSVDSDDDGLFDREEVKVYKTNPLKSDTDGDGYLDGDEVKAGYNPNGPGKLYQLE